VDNLVVLRTLSKAHGLAGIRCGALLATPRVVNLLRQVLAPNPLCRLGVDAALRALSPKGLTQMQKRIDEIREQREWLSRRLSRSPWVTRVWPSEANFVLIETEHPEALVNHCEAHGIILRDRSDEFHLENCVRISVGTEEENQRLGKVLSSKPNGK